MGLRHLAIMTAILLVMATSGMTDGTAPQWEVNVGDRFFFRLQIGSSPRALGITERTMTEDEIVYIEITSIQEITESSQWVPILDYSLCRSQMYLQNGSDLPSTGLLGDIESGLWNFLHLWVMPVGNWSMASELVLEKNEGLPLNASYEIVEHAASWGYIFRHPALNLTSTELWSKTDGTLLSLILVNGISERMTINESLDVTLERYTPSAIPEIAIVGVIGAVVVIAVIVFLKRRST
ncbi:MAG: hypothetical protein C4K48_05500 [Candidatus Thorarchaeota archaeon]|nr:MAG: hypothetical protein C4K48_05500 [Candidatus Thorarchaeota archaeon]